MEPAGHHYEPFQSSPTPRQSPTATPPYARSPRSPRPSMDPFNDHVSEWTCDHLAEWLHDRMMEKYRTLPIANACAAAIKAHHVDGQTMALLGHMDWCQLITTVGPRAYAMHITSQLYDLESNQQSFFVGRQDATFFEPLLDTGMLPYACLFSVANLHGVGCGGRHDLQVPSPVAHVTCASSGNLQQPVCVVTAAAYAENALRQPFHTSDVCCVLARLLPRLWTIFQQNLGRGKGKGREREGVRAGSGTILTSAGASCPCLYLHCTAGLPSSIFVRWINS